jgi:hypothetical protein
MFYSLSVMSLVLLVTPLNLPQAAPTSAAGGFLDFSGKGLNHLRGRYGKLEEVEAESGGVQLTFDGKQLVLPSDLWADAFWIQAYAKMGEVDVFLVGAQAGQSCPMKFIAISVKPDRKTYTSKPFGTCSDIVHIHRSETGIILDVHAWWPPASSPTKAQTRNKRYRYEEGVLRGG